MSKKFPSSWGGVFSATKTKVARNCLKWIDLVSKKFPSSWVGFGFSATKTKVAQNCLKWIDLVSKIFPQPGGGGLFCHKNQSCSKLPEMDRSGVKKFISCWRGEGGFSATKTKLAWNFPEMDRSGVKKFSRILGGVAFLPQKPKLLKIAWNG